MHTDKHGAQNGGVDAAALFHSGIAGAVTMRNTPPPLASNNLLCGGTTGALREAQDQPVAVFDHQFALLVNASIRAVKNVGAPRA